MRAWLGLLAWIALATGCAETVRCPDGEVFDERGECVPIPDAGTSPGPDAGTPDAAP